MNIPIYINIVELRYIDKFNGDEEEFDSIEELVEYVKSRACYSTTHKEPVFHAYKVVVVGKEKTIELKEDFYSGIPLNAVLEAINQLK